MNGEQPIALHEFKEATTGYKELDREINIAVDNALLRLKPIIRDILREEIKRCVNLEESEDEPKAS